MCWSGIFRGRTFRWVKRFSIFCTIGFFVFRLFGDLLDLCGNPALNSQGFCSFQGYLIVIMAMVGFVAFCFLTLVVYRLFLRRFLARHFPMSCGHRRCIFTGKSSKTLSEFLLTIDSELPTEEFYEDQQILIGRFLEDIKNAFHTNVTPTTSWEYIIVGSMTERYGIPLNYKRANIFSLVNGLKTDFDVMLCFDYEAMSACFSGRNGNIRIEVVTPFLGYANLTLVASGDFIKSNEVMKQAKRAVSFSEITNFPSKTCCIVLQSFAGVNYKIKGPAINLSLQGIVDFDITPCIKCCEWPPHSDWPTRQRYWPSQEDVTRIVSHGCHLVAKPAPFDEEQTSWRFSFSGAEVQLSSLVPNTARKCLLALKIIMKDHLQPVVAGITSYHLKTIFLNTLEKIPVDVWVDENIEECFFLLLNKLHDALLSGYCCHFWFRSVNLFAKFNDPKQVAVLIKKLERIAENPAPFIYDDGCCCLYPCCTRRHLYDSRGRRLTNVDAHDEVVCVERGSEEECDRSNHEVVLGCHDDEKDGSHDAGCGERRPILSQTSSLSNYGAVNI